MLQTDQKPPERSFLPCWNLDGYAGWGWVKPVKTSKDLRSPKVGPVSPHPILADAANVHTGKQQTELRPPQVQIQTRDRMLPRIPNFDARTQQRKTSLQSQVRVNIHQAIKANAPGEYLQEAEGVLPLKLQNNRCG